MEGWHFLMPILMILAHHHSVAQLKADNGDASFHLLSCQESLWSSGRANTQWALYHPHFCCRIKIMTLTPSACPQSCGSIIPPGACAHSCFELLPQIPSWCTNGSPGHSSWAPAGSLAYKQEEIVNRILNTIVGGRESTDWKNGMEDKMVLWGFFHHWRPK